MVAETLASDDIAAALPRIRLEMPQVRTVQAVRSLIDVKGPFDISMQYNLGDHSIYIEDAVICRTAA